MLMTLLAMYLGASFLMTVPFLVRYALVLYREWVARQDRRMSAVHI